MAGSRSLNRPSQLLLRDSRRDQVLPLSPLQTCVCSGPLIARLWHPAANGSLHSALIFFNFDPYESTETFFLSFLFFFSPFCSASCVSRWVKSYICWCSTCAWGMKPEGEWGPQGSYCLRPFPQAEGCHSCPEEAAQREPELQRSDAGIDSECSSPSPLGGVGQDTASQEVRCGQQHWDTQGRGP